MLHVALGWEYRGRKVTCGPVVYCAFEGVEGFGQRAEAFRRHHELCGNELRPPLYLVPARMNFVTEHADFLKAVRAQLGKEIPVAVVLDTLNRSLVGSESSDEDMSKYIAAADAVREAFNCAVIIVHHCGHEQSRPRGHSSLTGAVDAQLSCRRDRDDNINIEVEWMKDGAEGEKIQSRLVVMEVGTDEEGHPVTSCAVVPGKNEPGSIEKGALPRAAQIALRALQEAVTAIGYAPQGAENSEGGGKVVSLKQWRDGAYRLGISGSGNERAKQQAFHRAKTTLVERRLVGASHDQFWIIDPQRGGTNIEHP